MSITTNIWTSISDRDIAQAMSDDLDFAANVLIAAISYLEPAGLAEELNDDAVNELVSFFDRVKAAFKEKVEE